MSDIEKILVPDVGGDEVEVIEICFAVGDNLEADEGILTVETDKASMDIPAPFAGELVALTVSVGDKIKEGDVIAEMKSAAAGGESSEPEVAAPAEKSVEPEVKAEVAAQAPAPLAASAATSSEIIDIAVPDIGEDGEAQRHDDDFSFVSAWQYSGNMSMPVLYKEDLHFEFVRPNTRNYR